MRKVLDVNPWQDKNWDPRKGSERDQEKPHRHSWWRRFLDWCGNLSKREALKWLLGIIVVLALFKILVFIKLLPNWSPFPPVSKDKWQAVFLTNGQIYFGHLKNAGKNYAALEEVHYLQVAQQLQSQQAQGQQPNVNLVQLGKEIHGPENMMYISKSQITFWENLRDNSAVVQAILSLKVSGK